MITKIEATISVVACIIASTQPVQAMSASVFGAAKHDSVGGGKSSGEGGAAGPAAAAPAMSHLPSRDETPIH
ncbi:hypothetical protein PF007_g10799 [Phytophthora fragariae]|uniref:Uncharacterized protein n=1 Tax=Phytophthora fragariae TaxID=53985 RepID=A0A6A4DQK3_9STRA|nr:hypothetical protein PF003_g7033 [Phytophthora fragariae]KAE8938284.1 hypothetical protein PF009_g11833 [Phytophthora fragariae]KAE9011799.1 hypothetical protein PF011_g9206 [Phytophthora fragariae]KAE9113239.1 hypothetical protein PF007_g10799 [Phytophthora fragariae]KAE9143651.1 hypothetical protein PF006_g11343 [Phytophthora fragariae]